MATRTPDVSSPMPQAAVSASGNKQQKIPFRKATYERSQMLTQTVAALTAVQQIFPLDIVGDGYMYSVIDDVSCVTAANAAAVTFAEDGPVNVFQRMQIQDVSADVIALAGFDNYIDNIINGQFAVFLPDSVAHTTLFAGTNLLVTLTAGAGGTGGSFTFMLRYHVGTGHRDLMGIVGNQSRTMKYQLIETLAPSTVPYGVAPTTAGTVTIARSYINYAVPNDQNAVGVPQEAWPPNYGVIHRVTSTTLEVPSASSTVSHFMKQVGNTIRALGFVFRSGAGTTPRATGDTAALAPTQIVMKAGSATLFSESWRVRKEKNLRSFGIDLPAGVVIFDFIHDMDEKGGDELGDDWLHTQLLSDLHIEVTYPAGAWGAGSSLTCITDELLNVA
ncbi:MAG: hypothetical protein ACYDHE_17100 [Candidatus Acidiferrales bacterium]